MINPVKRIDRSDWAKKSPTEGKLIRNAKSPIDWSVKNMFDTMLSNEKKARK